MDELRWSFVRFKCLRALQYSFILNAAQSYVHLNPLFARPLSGSAVLLITAQGYGFRCLNMVYGTMVFHRSIAIHGVQCVQCGDWFLRQGLSMTIWAGEIRTL